MQSFITGLGSVLRDADTAVAFLAKEFATEGSEARNNFKTLLLAEGISPDKADDMMRQLAPEWKIVAANFLSLHGERYYALHEQEIS